MKVEIDKVKIAVTVPHGDVEMVKRGLFEAGAGTLSGSKYTCCSTCTETVGTFKPNGDAKPYIGKKNKLTIVDEIKLEVVCDVKKARAVIAKLREVHPYEEPAIDIIPLIDEESLEA